MPPEGDSGLDNGGSWGYWVTTMESRGYGVTTMDGRGSSNMVDSIISDGCNSWLSNYIVLDMDWVCDGNGHINGSRYSIGLGNSIRLGYCVGLWHVLVMDGGNFLGLVYRLGHGDIVSLFVDFKFRTNFSDLRSVSVDWAAKSLNWGPLDKEFGGRSFTSWDWGWDVEVDVRVGEGGSYSSRSNNSWCRSGVWSNGHGASGTKNGKGINIVCNCWWFWEGLCYLTEFSLYGISWDSCWCHCVGNGHNITHLFEFYSSWYVCCYLMLHSIGYSMCHWHSCGMDSHRTAWCGNTTRNQQG